MHLQTLIPFLDKLNEPIILLSIEYPFTNTANQTRHVQLEWYNGGFRKLFTNPINVSGDVTLQGLTNGGVGNGSSGQEGISSSVGTGKPNKMKKSSWVMKGTSQPKLWTGLSERSKDVDGLPKSLDDILKEKEREPFENWIRSLVAPSCDDDESDICSEDECNGIKSFNVRVKDDIDIQIEWTPTILGLGQQQLEDGSHNKLYIQLTGRTCVTDKWLRVVLPKGIVAESICTRDWSTTSLGKVDNWSSTFLASLSFIMTIAVPAALIWGDERRLFYNDSYSRIFSKPPDSVGGPLSVLRKVAYETLGLKKYFDRVFAGETVQVPKMQQIFRREDGTVAEKFLTTTTPPLRSEYGHICGALSFILDTTQTYLSERRLVFLKRVSERFSSAASTSELYGMIPDLCQEAVKDVGFAAVAIPDKIPVSEESMVADPKAFPLVDVWISQTKKEILKLSSFDELPSGFYPETFTRRVLILPVRVCIEGQSEDSGCVVIGVPSHLEYDDEYRKFADGLAREVAEGIRAVRSLEIERRRAEELAKLDEQKTRFFTSVSHEIRTPLSLVLGPIEDCISSLSEGTVNSLLLPELTKSGIEYCVRAPDKKITQILKRLDLARENGVRIKSLVDRLLDFHQLEAGKMKPKFSRTNIASLTKNTVEIFRLAIETKGLECDTTRISDIDEVCCVDIDMWEKILFNLISNAIKFTEKGSISFSLTANKPNSTFIFEISDTGPGIPEFEKELIFTRFYRSRETPQHVEGTGIGLSLAQELVGIHGGDIHVANKLSGGCVFTVTMPLVPSQSILDSSLTENVSIMGSETSSGATDSILRSGHLLSEASRMVGKAAEQGVKSEMMEMTVFIVDDNPEMREYVEDILSERWTTRTFSSAEDAILGLESLKCDLIVSDVILPKMSGIDLLVALKSHEEHRDIPIFLLTAKSSEEARLTGLQSGADDYIIKPFSRKELLSRVTTRLELQRLRKGLEEMVQSRTAQLNIEKKRFEHLARVSPVALFQLEDNFTPIYISDKFSAMLGTNHPCTSFVEDIRQSVKSDYAEKLLTDYKETLIGKHTPVRHEVECLNGNWIVAEAIPNLEDSGHLVGAVGCLIDVSEMKKLERERLLAMEDAERAQRKRADEAEEMKKQKESFIDMICHEIRNPLSAILSNNELIADYLSSAVRVMDTFPDRTKPVLELNELIQSITDCSSSISVCAKHQKCVADDVLHMSKLSLDLVRLNPTDFDPVQLAYDVLSALEADMKSKKIESETVVFEGIEKFNGKRIIGDPVRVTQIIVNLMTNAVKFTSKAEIRKIVLEIDAEETPDKELMIYFGVKDSGIGMTPDQLSQLFQKFQQASQKGGSIQVTSEVGHGTTFKFSIKAPRYVGPERKRASSLEEVINVRRSQGNLAPEKLQPPKILVVDDNDINRKVLSKQLTKEGFVVEQAINGLEAVKKAVQCGYALILMDVEMPVMDGPTAVTHIRQNENQHNLIPVPIVSVTGNARQEQIDSYLAIGIQKVLIKPYTREKDAFSEKFCGEGVPLWAAQPAGSLFNLLDFPVPIEKSPFKVDKNGIPSQADCAKHDFGIVQLSYAAGSAYQRLYENYDGLRDSFVNYWKLLASVFGKYDNVLGYDLMNEPFAGNVVTNPGLLVPGVADRVMLQSFYDAVAAGIREVDQKSLIFFESVTWDNFVVGFDHVPGGSQNGAKSVLSFHHYDKQPNLFNLTVTFDERLLDMARLGCGGMMTEKTAASKDANIIFSIPRKTGNNVEPIRIKSQQADKYLMSYTGWEYTDYYAITGTNNGIRDPDTGLVRPDMANVYSRTYATSISGTPLSMKFDDPTGRFELVFKVGDVTGLTEIRLNEESHYPGGYQVLVSSSTGLGKFNVVSSQTGASVTSLPRWADEPASSPFDILGFPVPIEKKPFKLDANGIPSRQDCEKHEFGIFAGSYAAGSVYDRLYTNYNGLRDSFVDYWKLLARTFGKYDNVIGYDLINEPFAGNVVTNPGLLVPGVADRVMLQPFYDITVKGIKEVDTKTLIFFESVTWDNFYVGFDHVPGGKQYGEQSVLSFHYYQNAPNIGPLNVTYTERLLDMLRLGSGGMLTEYSMGWNNGGNVEYIRDRLRTSDKFLMSTMGWEYTDYFENTTGFNDGIRDPATGLVREDMANVYSRTYATAIAGIPLEMEFD
ncbi:hypothetical protein HDU76_013834, partial [Blyttiomyces sp. JEL0837]